MNERIEAAARALFKARGYMFWDAPECESERDECRKDAAELIAVHDAIRVFDAAQRKAGDPLRHTSALSMASWAVHELTRGGKSLDKIPLGEIAQAAIDADKTWHMEHAAAEGADPPRLDAPQIGPHDPTTGEPAYSPSPAPPPRSNEEALIDRQHQTDVPQCWCGYSHRRDPVSDNRACNTAPAADPPWLDEAAKQLYREEFRPEEELTDTNVNAVFAAIAHDGDCTDKCYTCLFCEAERARRLTRAVLAFAARQPRPITEAKVEAAWQAWINHDDAQSHGINAMRAALEAGIKNV